jgi:hypothetical protein
MYGSARKKNDEQQVRKGKTEVADAVEEQRK